MNSYNWAKTNHEDNDNPRNLDFNTLKYFKEALKHTNVQM